MPKTKTPLEPLPHNAEWHTYITGQGGAIVDRYKGQDIHRCGISFYVNGRWIGTSKAAAKSYINNSLSEGK